jgi:hypothetical protein
MLLNITFERIIYRKKSVIHTNMCIKKRRGGWGVRNNNLSFNYNVKYYFVICNGGFYISIGFKGTVLSTCLLKLTQDMIFNVRLLKLSSK